jgi:hypothetical protein
MVDKKFLYSINIKPLQLFVILGCFSFLFIFIDSGASYNISVLLIFFLTSLLSLFGIFISIDNESFSLNKSFCLFYYFFFSLAPAIQFKNKSSFYIDGYMSEEIYLKAGAILLLVLVAYLLLYHLGSVYIHKFNNNKNQLKVTKKTEKENNLIVHYSLVLFSIVASLFLIKWDFSLLIYRPFAYNLKDNTNFGLLGYAILLVVRLIPLIVLLQYKLSTIKNNKHTYFFLTMLLIICFPTSLSRGVLAIVYIPVLLLFFPLIKRGVNYSLVFMLGLLIVFPLFNNFRYLREGNYKFGFELFDSGHFDAFQNFAILIDQNIITNGRQFLGSLLFFVQESQWPNRPHGTGHLLGEKVGYSMLNVAMPYFGEGYANWGYFGIGFFLIVIVFVNVMFDGILRKLKTTFWVHTLFLILLGFEFYLMRGDLYSSVKIIVSFSLALGFVYTVFLVYQFLNKNHS